MSKKLHTITVRIGDEDMRFLRALASRLELPTDGRPIIGRAVQEILRVTRSSVTPSLAAEQGKQGIQRMQRCLPGAAEAA